MIFDFLNETGLPAAALIIILTVLVYTLVHRRDDRLRNRVYIMMLVFSLICTVCEIIETGVCYVVKDPAAARIMLTVIEYIRSAFRICIPLLFTYYMILVNGSHRHMHRLLAFLFFAPVVTEEILLLTNPIHRLGFYYDDMLIYHGGIGTVIAYGIAVVYVVVGALNLIKHRQAVNHRRFMAMMLFFPVVLSGIILQLFLKGVNCEFLAAGLSMLGIMLTMENEDDKMDAATGVYNRSELRMVLNNLFRLGQRFHIITVRLSNYDILIRLSGKGGADPIMERVAEALKQEYYWYRIFRASTTSFMILTDMSDEEVVLMSERIYVLFLEGVYVDGIDTPVRADIMRAKVPDELHSTEEIMYMVDGALPEERGRGILSGDRLKYLTRYSELEAALDRGLENNGFEIYYQSIHRMEGLKPYAVKALLRLKDEKLGELKPLEFISQAERTGQIHRLGDLVLEEVCRFIKSGLPEKLGYSCVNVNLSFVQCMAPGFAEHVVSLVKKYGVDPSCINFEITKPVTKDDHELLKRLLEALKKHGFGFSMEDFGSGYPNLEALFALDFDVVKIDRSILWEAMKNDTGKVVLDNSIRMIKQLKRKVLIEGIESSSQIELLREYDVDYLQGYYFSKPAPAADVYRLTPSGRGR